jgi:CheY-like chemotaxis protein
MKILLLEDEPHNTQDAQRILAGHELVTTYEASLALAMIKHAKNQEKPYDLVISDFGLRGGNTAAAFIAAQVINNMPLLVWSSTHEDTILNAVSKLGIRRDQLAELIIPKYKLRDAFAEYCEKLEEKLRSAPPPPFS